MTAPVCQSCGMPMTSEELFGKEASGARNDDYCIYCYDKGAFTSPNSSLEQMVEECVPHVGMPEEEARQLLRQELPKLKRWQGR